MTKCGSPTTLQDVVERLAAGRLGFYPVPCTLQLARRDGSYTESVGLGPRILNAASAGS
jgi:hypothetical protein